MKAYFIYRHDGNGINPYLYAVTDNKELKNSFIKERKKNLFTVVKKDLNQKDYKSFINEHHGYVLGRRGYETSASSSLSKIHVFLTSTMNEEMDVYTKADMVILDVGRNTQEYCCCFNEKLLNALNILHYFEIYKFKNKEEYLYEDYFVNGVQPFRSDNYDIDSLGVFMYLYGHTLDRKEIGKE
jgi:hypothetical protein